MTRPDNMGADASREWQPVDGWPQYEVSRCGRVRKKNGKECGQWLNNHGYALVRLSRPRAMLRVHRLVAGAFIPNPHHKPCVNHLNNDRSDNRAENLEWCTQAENIRHADNQGRMQRDYWSGKRPPVAALSDEQVRDLRATYSAGGVSLEALGHMFGISKRAAHRCVKQETYSDVL